MNPPRGQSQTCVPQRDSCGGGHSVWPGADPDTSWLRMGSRHLRRKYFAGHGAWDTEATYEGNLTYRATSPLGPLCSAHWHRNRPTVRLDMCFAA